MKEKVVGIIPARYASSRFPGKILAPIMGKTLIQRTYEQAKTSNYLDALYIATDDQRIQEHVASFGAQVILTSPECPSGTVRIVEALQAIDPRYSIVINIQGDLPCIDSHTIDAITDRLHSHPEDLIVTACTTIDDRALIKNSAVVKCVLDKNQYALYFSRALIPFVQKEQKVLFLKHIGVYGYRRKFLELLQTLEPTPLQETEDLEQLAFLEHGYKIAVVAVPHETPSVDLFEDILRVEEWIQEKGL